MNKKNWKLAVIGISAFAFSAGQFQSASALETVDVETSIAGAGVVLEQYYGNAETKNAVYELLFGSEEETAEPTETEGETTQAPEEVLPAYAVAKTDNYINVRTAPDTTSDATIIGKMYNNAVAVILDAVEGEGGTWYYVTSGTVTGYIKADLFAVGEEAEAIMAQTARLVGTVDTPTPNLYVRSGPSTDTSALAMVAAGTRVAIVGEEGDFYQIQLDEFCTGYVHKDYIVVTASYKEAISLDEERILAEQLYEQQMAQEAAAPETAPVETPAPETAPAVTPAPEEAPAAPSLVGVTAVYTGGIKYVGDTVSGAEMSVVAVYSDGSSQAVDGWGCSQVGIALHEGENTFIVTYNGLETAFVVTASARPAVPETQAPETQAPETTAPEPSVDTSAQLRASIVNYAMQFLGNPYVYGGNDLVHGVDCSGFTKGVYANFGIAITRTSQSQAMEGRQIALTDVQPGDLIFYTNVNNGVIGHVALYIGNGQIIHAANETLGIIVSDMYYRQPCKAVTLF